MIRSIILTCCFALFCGFAVADGLGKDEKQKLKKAEGYLENEKWHRALPLFEELLTAHPEDASLKYKTAICHLHHKAGREKAKVMFKELGQAGENFPELKLYLGMVHHLLYELDEAIEYFEQYLTTVAESSDNAKKARRYIENCNNAKALMQRPIDVSIELLKPPSSVEGSEYSPQISPDESVLICTYRGKSSKGGLMDDAGELDPIEGEYYEDIIISYKQEDGKWSEPSSIGNSINTFGHDAATSLSVDGQRLFIYKSGEGADHDVYMSELSGDRWSYPRLISGEVNTSHWEGSATLAADGTTLYFASDRPGGYGGRDLYKALRNPDGSWGNIENLGPTVNTEYDEDSPFIHPDGVNLYYSSVGHNSMGGHDIFHTTWDGVAWNDPENIGYPVNTTDDDRYYVVSADGERGYFSSARASGGEQHDIFSVTPGAYNNMPVLVLIVGEVLLDEEPIGAKIILENLDGDVVGDFLANSKDGKFQFTALPGNKYKLNIYPEAEGVDPYFEIINIDSTDVFTKIRHQFKFYTFAFTQLRGERQTLALQSEIDNAFGKPSLFAMGPNGMLPGDSGSMDPRYNPDDPNNPNFKDPKDPKDPKGPKDPDGPIAYDEQGYPVGMIYTVQVAAYRNPWNYKYSFLTIYGKVDIKSYPDGVTRFNMGEFEKLEDARALQAKIIKAGQEDAWVTGLYNGKRIILMETGELKEDMIYKRIQEKDIQKPGK